MRKITLLSMISLDGVLQGPGNPEEDPTGNFKYGGWTAPFSDEIYDQVVMDELHTSDYLLGRKTWDIWADYWPKHEGFWPSINESHKYVFSNTLKNSDSKVKAWNKSVVIHNLEDIINLKNSEGPDLQVWGSSELAQLLFQHDLIDYLRLKIHPITLGKGKNLFGQGIIPAAFTLTESLVTTTGVIIANYARSGEVKTGRMGV